ncbi:MAG: putative transcriptional regulator [Candidatus Eremiobacteraeota bacterium]|nr:putative transcriptional regulator [Candidatus Eremiobacteraeota bacterium]
MQVSIGDFSRMTHLSVKALRHYHDVGLLEPASVDAQTGYRSYDVAQVAPAQIIRRFRDLGMPVDQVKAVLAAPDLTERNALIVDHLKRMESQVAEVQSTVASLRTLLEPATPSIAVEYRSVPRMRAAAITKVVKRDELAPWWENAFEEIYDVLRAAGVRSTGPAGGVYPTELFADEIGEVVVFVPIGGALQTAGEVRVVDLPAVELAVAVHHGALRDADRTYGSLGAHVAERAIGIEGPIRERYIVASDDTPDDGQLVTEIGWPVFRTTAPR